MLNRRVRDIYNPSLVWVTPETPVPEALALMRDRLLSCLFVARSDMALGIFTERGLVKFAARRDLDIRNYRVSDIMDFPIVTVSVDDFVYEAFGKLSSANIRHLGVVDEEGSITGVVTQTDILENVGYEYFLELDQVSRIMSVKLALVEPDLAVPEAIRLMVKRPVSCLVAAEENRPVGIVTERDLAWLFIENSDIGSLKVSDIMSSPPKSVTGETHIHNAVELMRASRIRRLVVVDGEGRLRGMLTQSDLVKSLGGKYHETLEEALREHVLSLKPVADALTEKRIYLENILKSCIDVGIVATDSKFCINYYNEAAANILGPSFKDVIGMDARTFHARHKIDATRFYKGFLNVQDNGAHAFTMIIDREGEKRQIRARVTGIWGEDKQLTGYALVVRDITERMRNEETIRRMAFYDQLTGLPNRSLFMERLQQEIARSIRKEIPFAVMVLDLNHFKQVNDNHGHLAGDEVLAEAARRMRESVRQSDTVARMGGDEFMFICPEVGDDKNARHIASKILKSLAESFDVEGLAVKLGASIGVAVFPYCGHSSRELLICADHAMYEAKAMGRASDGFALKLHNCCAAD